MVTKKTVKEYSKRQRINLSKSDGFKDDETIVILSTQEYEKLQSEILNRESEILKVTKETELYKKRFEDILKSYNKQQKELDTKVEKLLEVSLKPINETHKKQLEDKNKQINELTNQINTMIGAFNQFNIRINTLTTLDILFRKKHIEIISDFNESITLVNNSNPIVNADIKQVPDRNSKD